MLGGIYDENPFSYSKIRTFAPSVLDMPPQLWEYPRSFGGFHETSRLRP